MTYAHHATSTANTINVLNLLQTSHQTKQRSSAPSLSSKTLLIELNRQERLRLIRQWKHYSQNPYFTTATQKNASDAVIVDFTYLNADEDESESIVVFGNNEWEVRFPSNNTLTKKTTIHPKKAISSLKQMSVKQELALEQIFVKLATRFDNLFFAFLRCKITWLLNAKSGTLEASYEPLGIEGSKCLNIGDMPIAKRLAQASDIHFKDVFYE